MNTPQGKLYLIPVPIAEVEHSQCLPELNRALLPTIRHYIVENVRSARRFYELNKHTPEGSIESFLTPIASGEDIGIISEAGCPAVADPGADVVAIAQRKGIEVIPLVGPSSILLALMGSGFNGQGFAFSGYLPIEDAKRQQAMKELEHRVRSRGETQIFIETPYRNVQLVEQLIRHCSPDLKLCIASGLTSEHAILQTKKLNAWRGHIPDIHKVPTIFLLGR